MQAHSHDVLHFALAFDITIGLKHGSIPRGIPATVVNVGPDIRKSMIRPTVGSLADRRYRPGATLGDVLMTTTRWPTTVGRIAHTPIIPSASHNNRRDRARRTEVVGTLEPINLGMELLRQAVGPNVRVEENAMNDFGPVFRRQFRRVFPAGFHFFDEVEQ